MESPQPPNSISVRIWFSFMLLSSLCTFAKAAYPSYPGLYLGNIEENIDRCSISVGTGSTSFTWRETLPSIYRWGFSVNSYDISNTNQFSFMSDLSSVSVTGAQLILVDFGAGVTWIEFYVIVLTEDNPQT